MDRRAARTFSPCAVYAAALARRVAVFRSLRVGHDAAQRAGVHPRGRAVAYLQAQPRSRTYRARQVFGLSSVSYRQLQGALRRAAVRGRLRHAGRAGRLHSQRRLAARAELPGGGDGPGFRGAEVRAGAALQTAARRSGPLRRSVGHRQRPHRRRRRFFALARRRCGLLQFRPYPPRVGRRRLHRASFHGRRG